MSINVFTNYYQESDIIRKEEMEICFCKNYNNKNIKLITIESQNRLTFNDYFEFINRYSNSSDNINIICNADIYFDETITLSKNIDPFHVYALNRWDVDSNYNSIHYNMIGSSDAWVFKGVPEGIVGDYYLGWHGCDGRFGYEVLNAGYELYNPSLSIKTMHVHMSNRRNYNAFKNLVAGPYAGAPACTLDQLVLGYEIPASMPSSCPISNRKRRARI